MKRHLLLLTLVLPITSMAAWTDGVGHVIADPLCQASIPIGSPKAL